MYVIHAADLQVPDTVSKLQSQLPIARAQMRVRLTFPVTSNKWVHKLRESYSVTKN